MIISLTDDLSAFRVESYGNMQIQLSLDYSKNSVLLLEGPLSEFGDTTPVAKSSTVRQVPSSKKINLKEPGVYRIIVQRKSLEGKNQLKLQAHCISECQRGSVPAAKVLRKFPELQNVIVGEIKNLVTNEDLSQILIHQFRSKIATEDQLALDHFPILPIESLPLIRDHIGILLQQRHQDQAKADPVVQGRLEDLLGPCTAPRVTSEPFPGLSVDFRYGHFPNLALTACQNSHSMSFSKVLTSLAVGNGSWIEYQGKKLTTATALAKQLILHGHQIVLEQQRSYANFLSATLQGKYDLRWPAWIDTGITVNNEPLLVPMGHSQHVWKISGPLVDARISFFLGTSGAGFFGQTDTRPAWTGKKVSYTADSQTHLDLILKSFQASELYLQNNRRERNSLGKKVASDGYGYVGVCNDSDSFLEMITRGTYSGYPLVRDHLLNQNFSESSILGKAFRQLPDDTHPIRNTQTKTDVLRRILEMNPLPWDSDQWLNLKLREQLQSMMLY